MLEQGFLESDSTNSAFAALIQEFSGTPAGGSVPPYKNYDFPTFRDANDFARLVRKMNFLVVAQLGTRVTIIEVDWA